MILGLWVTQDSTKGAFHVVQPLYSSSFENTPFLSQPGTSTLQTQKGQEIHHGILHVLSGRKPGSPHSHSGVQRKATRSQTAALRAGKPGHCCHWG